MRPWLLPASFDRERFLRDYWQKKPLLIRGDGRFVDPISPDELAGLACEAVVESRLVLSDAQGSRWELRHGPFNERDFAQLPPTHWSLLVQAVDQWHDGVRGLLREFDFIPRWRIDDVMISFASDGGGVGPHFDYYDVFLIQGLGRKRWRLGGLVDSGSPLLPDTPLRLLQDFHTEEDWIVEPGDILYLPPNLAHHGVAIGDSVTYSIGFRTPSVAEILEELSAALAQDLPPDLRYVDTHPRVPAQAGELTAEVAEQLVQLLQQPLQNRGRLLRWFGRSMTSAKYPELSNASAEPLSCAELMRELEAGEVLLRNPASRLAWARQEDGAELYADGHLLPCSPALLPLLPALCDPFTEPLDWLDAWLASAEGRQLITDLFNHGCLYLADDEED
jgi:50S ribosomal protein L16 3-hydroxylase